MGRKRKCPIKKNPPTAGIKLPRLKQYRRILNNMLTPGQRAGGREIALTGSRRALLVMFMAWLDAYDHPDVQETIMQVLRWTWGHSPYRRPVGTPTDRQAALQAEEPVPPQEPDDGGLSDEIKQIFQLALKGESNEPVQSPES